MCRKATTLFGLAAATVLAVAPAALSPAGADPIPILVAQAEQRPGPGRMVDPGMTHPRAMQHFRSFDRNNDGALDSEELTGHQDVMFDFLDDDGNDSVSLEEFVNARPGMGPRHAMMGSMQSRATQFKSMDRNSDGKVTRDEFRMTDPRMMEMRDTNGDGRITPDELGRRGPRGPA